MPTPAIVVGIDGSDSALDAARWAATEATRRKVPLRLVHTYEIPVGYTPGVVVPTVVIEAMIDEGERHVRAAAEAVSAIDAGIATEPVVQAGGAVQFLVEESRNAALIVLGSRGLGGFSGLVLGSTAVAVAAYGHCPVVTVRGAEHPDGPFVVGVSGSPEAEAALGFAFEEASSRGRPLVAVHAWAEPSMIDILRAQGAPIWDFAPAELHASEVLAERLAGWQEKYPDVSVTRVVDHEHPVQALLRQAEAAALVVVGSRGRGALSGALLGSTSQQLLYHASCPVAVVPPGSGPRP